jgi:hypothetical protein
MTGGLYGRFAVQSIPHAVAIDADGRAGRGVDATRMIDRGAPRGASMVEQPKRTVPDVCRLTLTIRGIDYRVTPIARPEGRSWRLIRIPQKSCTLWR